MTAEIIFKMKLHEACTDGYTEIKRVPGGWIYTQTQYAGREPYGFTSTFVPYSDEFKPV